MAEAPYTYPQYPAAAAAWQGAAYPAQPGWYPGQEYAYAAYGYGYPGYAQYQQGYAPEAVAQQAQAYYQAPSAPQPAAESTSDANPPPPPESEAPPPPPETVADQQPQQDAGAAQQMDATPSEPAAATAAPSTETTYSQPYTDGTQQQYAYQYPYDPSYYAAYPAQYTQWPYAASTTQAQNQTPYTMQAQQPGMPAQNPSAPAPQQTFQQAYQAYQSQPAYQSYPAQASTLQSLASANSRPPFTPQAAQTPGGLTTAPWHVQQLSQSPKQPSPAQHNITAASPQVLAQQTRTDFVIKKQMSKAYAGVVSAAATKASAPSYIKVDQPQQPVAKAAEPSTQESAGAKKLSGYPPALQAYVERAFNSVTTPDDKKAMADKMRDIIKDANEKGELWTRAWDKLKLPSLREGSPAPATVTQRPATTTQAHWQADRPTRGPEKASPRDRAGDWRKDKDSWNAGRGGRGDAGRSSAAKYAAGRQGRGGRDAQDYDRDHDSDMSDSSQDTNGRVGAMTFAVGPPHKEGQLVDAFRKARRQDRFGSPLGRGAKFAKTGRGAAPGAALRVFPKRRIVDVESGDEDDILENTVVKGTCTTLEKSYFRLTSAPDPALVRPEPVLVQALDRLVRLLRERAVNYFYANDQFKGMRQDCTVQHIRNELAVRVYEAHARAAMEYGDLADYNQCQTQAHLMYADGVSGCRAEFVAYRVLYATLHAREGEARQLLTTLRNIPPELMDDPSVAHALRVRSALTERNFPRFFRLYRTAPALGRAILDALVPKARFYALTQWVKAMRPATLPVPFIAESLGFVCVAGKGGADGSVGGEVSGSAAGVAGEAGSGGVALPGCMEPFHKGRCWPEEEEEDGLAACIAWLHACNAVVIQEAGAPDSAALLDTKASTGVIAMPEEKKVAHGDNELSIADFLARELS